MSASRQPPQGGSDLGVWIAFGAVFALIIGVVAAMIGWAEGQRLLAVITGGGAAVVVFGAVLSVLALVKGRG